jgi:hypothetical protein
MATVTDDLEQKLNEVFVKKAPALPEGGKKALVQWAPIISLIVGVLTLLSAWSLWHWAHNASDLVNYANSLCNAFGANSSCDGVNASRFTLWLWLGVIFLLAEGVLYLLAYPGLRDRKKQGWNYLYYGALLNVAYAIVSLFTDYDKVGHFIGALIGSAVSFYILFQIRAAYAGVVTAHKGSRQKPVAK